MGEQVVLPLPTEEMYHEKYQKGKYTQEKSSLSARMFDSRLKHKSLE